MTQYQAGDRVRVRPDLREYYLDNHHGCVVEEMFQKAGKVYTVERLTHSQAADDGSGDDLCARFERCYWLDEWLEPVDFAVPMFDTSLMDDMLEVSDG